MKNTFPGVAAALIALLVAVAAFAVYSGVYPIAADEPHWGVTTRVLETVRNRSIQRRARDIEVPNLDDPARVLRGAGQYAAMCANCHLAPGVKDTPTRVGLYPTPPNLTQVRFDAQRAFWVTKHGVKMTAMPAWGRSHGDEALWDVVAFINKLPSLSPQEYKEIVAKAPRDEEMDMRGAPGVPHVDVHAEEAKKNEAQPAHSAAHQ